MPNNPTDRLQKSYQHLKQLGTNYLTRELINYFHTQIIFISSKFEGVEITEEEVETLVRNYPKKTKTKKASLLQAYGQKEALEYVEEQSAGEALFKVDTIAEIHRIVFSENPDVQPGRLRTSFVQFRHTPFMTALPFMISQEMSDFRQWLTTKQSKVKRDNIWEIMKFATEAHYKIVEIHPFKDGNGRVARIFLNLILRHFRLPYVVIPKTVNDQRMLETLQEGNKGDLGPLTDFFAELLFDSLNIVFDYWNNKQKSELRVFPS